MRGALCSSDMPYWGGGQSCVKPLLYQQDEIQGYAEGGNVLTHRFHILVQCVNIILMYFLVVSRFLIIVTLTLIRDPTVNHCIKL